MNPEALPNVGPQPGPGRQAARWMRLLLVAAVLAALMAVAALPVFTRLAGQSTADAAPPAAPGDGSPADQALSQLPLRFIANTGQTDPAVRFTVQGAGHTLFFTPREVVFGAVRGIDESARRSLVRLSFPGANTDPAVEGWLPLPGGANYFIGNDPARWRANVPTYAALVYRDLYPGVDMVYSGQAGRLKSEFHVAPGADPSVIRLTYAGVEAARLLPDGSLSLQTALGELVEAAPVVYQAAVGRQQAVDSRYVMLADQTSEVGVVVRFELGDYDPARPLIIDPILSYSSFLGGSGSEATGTTIYDHAGGIALDPDGNMYIAGQTSSTDFPTDAQSIQGQFGGQSDVFVTQLISTSGVYTYGYSTYLGGSDVDYANGIVVDATGAASIVGTTRSSNFPVFAAPQMTHSVSYDAFITRIISQSGAYTFTYSTYLGGSGVDYGHGIALDGAGNAWVVGETTSSDLFTTTDAIQPAFRGSWDAFVTQIVNTGSYTFGYSSFMGGTGVDRGLAIAVDTDDNVFVTGETGSIDFPLINAPQPVWGVAGLALSSAELEATEAFTYPDAFVAQIINSGTYTYAYSTYLGGTFADCGRGIVVDSAGNAMVTGNTGSPDFPTTPDAVQPGYGGGAGTGGGGDAFVTHIVDASGVYTFGYSTFVGGGSDDVGYAIVLGSSDYPIIAGGTASSNFPTHFPVQASLGGAADAFVTQLVSGTTALTYGISTYLGGAASDSGRALAVDALGDIYLTGQTQSSDFPTHNALDDTLSGTSDAFVTRLGWGGLMITKTVTPTTVAPGESVVFTLVYTNDSPTPASSVVVDDYVPIPITYTQASYTSSGAAITPTGSYSFTWDVADLGPVSGGRIEILAILTGSTSLTPGTSITNCASITGSGAYPNTAYNLGCAVFVVGSERSLYLPAVFKQL